MSKLSVLVLVLGVLLGVAVGWIVIRSRNGRLSDAVSESSLVARVRARGGDVVRPSPEYVIWLKTKQVPEPVATQLRDCVTSKPFYVKSVRIDLNENDVMSVNEAKGVPIALKAGLLIVGACGNGDSVVIDVRDRVGAAGFFCAETMWSEKNPRDAYLPLAPSLERLLAGIQEGKIGEDYFEAKERRKRN